MKRTLFLVITILIAIIARGQYISSSNLPIIIINTDNGASIPDEPKIGATMKILYLVTLLKMKNAILLRNPPQTKF